MSIGGRRWHLYGRARWGALISFNLLEALSCIEVVRLNVFVLAGVLDLLVLAGGYYFVLVISLQTYGLQGFLVTVDFGSFTFVTPEGGFDVYGHCLGHPVLNVIGKEVWVYVAEVINLSVRIDNRTFPTDMSNVFSLFPAVGAHALGYTYVFKMSLGPSTSRRDVGIYFLLQGGKFIDNILGNLPINFIGIFKVRSVDSGLSSSMVCHPFLDGFFRRCQGRF